MSSTVAGTQAGLEQAEMPGVFTFATSSIAVPEKAGKALITIVRKDGAAGRVTVSYATQGASATTDIDFASTSGTVSFDPGVTEQTIEVPVVDDTEFEWTEFFAVNLFSPTGGAHLDFISSLSAFIQDDDDGPGIFCFATTTSDVMENAGFAFVKVIRERGAIGTATISYSAGSVGNEGPDFRSTSGTLIFEPGVTEQTIAIPLINDSVHEEDESFHINLSSTSEGSGMQHPSVHLVTIRDDDPSPPPPPPLVPVVGFHLPNSVVPESGGHALIKVVRSGNLQQTVSINCRTSAGTAGEGSDFTTENRTLTFYPNATELTVFVPIIHDDVNEELETFELTLSDPTGGAIIKGSTSHAVTIFGDDGPPVIAFAGGVTAVEEASGGAVLSVFRSGSAASFSQVQVSAFPGTASGKSDYSFLPTTVSFPPGATTQTLFVPIIDNALREEIEEFKIILSNPAGATLGGDTHIVRILEDLDDVPAFQRATYRGVLATRYVWPPEFGSFIVTITPDGSFSGSLKTLGMTVPFKGNFRDAATPWGGYASTKAFPGGFLELQSDEENSVLHVSFYRRDGRTFSLMAARDARGSRFEPVPETNRYTALLESQLPPAFPAGYLSAQVFATGKVEFSGMVPDGTRFRSVTRLAEDGSFPIFIPSKRNRRPGLAGSVGIDVSANLAVSGDLHWQKPADSRPPYSGGLQSEVMLLSGAVFRPVSQGRILDDLDSTEGRAVLKLGATGSLTAVELPLVWNPENIIDLSPSDLASLKVSIENDTGVLAGSFFDEAGKLREFHGVSIQQAAPGADRVAGFFLGDDLSSRFEIIPQSEGL